VATPQLAFFLWKFDSERRGFKALWQPNAEKFATNHFFWQKSLHFAKKAITFVTC
jgi:hypothetical protein